MDKQHSRERRDALNNHEAIDLVLGSNSENRVDAVLSAESPTDPVEELRSTVRGLEDRLAAMTAMQEQRAVFSAPGAANIAPTELCRLYEKEFPADAPPFTRMVKVFLNADGDGANLPVEIQINGFAKFTLPRGVVSTIPLEALEVLDHAKITSVVKAVEEDRFVEKVLSYHRFPFSVVGVGT